MKKLLATAAIAAALVAPSVASASIVATMECGLIRVTPPDRDPNPTVKTMVSVMWMPNGRNPVGFIVDHFSARGAVYSRQEQYSDLRFWTARNTDNWSGVWIRDPRVTMVGTLVNSNPAMYVERIYRDGQLQTTITSTCRFVPEESH